MTFFIEITFSIKYSFEKGSRSVEKTKYTQSTIKFDAEIYKNF